MSCNCPKCHCGCLFEDHGRLVCLNCGAETTRTVAKNVRHVHNYQTYTGKRHGAEDRPQTVRQSASSAPRQAARGGSWQPATDPQRRPVARATPSRGFRHPYLAPNPAADTPLNRPEKKRSDHTLLWIILVVVFFSTILPAVVGALDGAVSRTPEPAPEPDYVQAEESGILYWTCEGELSDEDAGTLNALVLEYNLDHDMPDAMEVNEYLSDHLDEMPVSNWTVQQDGSDVWLSVRGD